MMAALRVLAVAAVLASPSTAEPAHGNAGSLVITEPDGTRVPMPLEHTRARIEVSAFVARATVEQIFSNPFDHPVEAVYTFPLGDRAAVDDFEIEVGDRVIRAEIRRREEARETYEAARSAGYGAALLEQERPNVFTQSVANLEPGGSVTVRIRTVEVLRYEAGVYTITFPLVVGPRYVPGRGASFAETSSRPAPTAGVADAERITPPVLKPGLRSGHDVQIEVALDAGVPVAGLASPSHRILTEKEAGGRRRIRLAPDETIPNKDFVLRWSVAADTPAVGLLAHRTGVDGFFTLLVQPKGEVSAEEATPKEVVLVLDTSGSMSGAPLEAAKRFASEALRTLGPRDTFNLVRFAGAAETFSAEPLAGDAASVERALGWIEGLAGGGGTEMLRGFEAAFARPADPRRLRVVVFLTDGYIGNESEILARIGAVVGEARIHALGVGAGVNHYLLDRMAALGRGAYVFIRPDANVDQAVDRFRSWVTRPYLTDLEIDWGALPVVDMIPEKPRDLGSGQTLAIVGRYIGAGEGDIVARGRLGGRYWEQKLRVALPHFEPAHAPLASLWARHRIEESLLATPAAVPDSVRAEVTALALEYRLMSPFTSFVAVDDTRIVNPSGQAATVRQALPLPEGVSFAGVFGATGPAAMRSPADADRDPEDHVTKLAPERFRVEGSVVTVVMEGVLGGVVGGVAGPRPREAVAVLPNHPQAAPPPQAAQSAIDLASAAGGAARGPAERGDLPLGGGFFQNVLHLKGTALGADEGPSADAHGVAGARDFQAMIGTGARAGLPLRGGPADSAAAAAGRLRDAAWRVLADLAEDGRLSGAEGRPSLAALLAAQTPAGAVADDAIAHAIATWALWEASVAAPADPWIREASGKAAAHLAALRTPRGWPARPGGDADPETTRWARLVLDRMRPDASIEPLPPTPAASPELERLLEALGAAAGAPSTRPIAGRSPFDRLVRAIGRGHLAITG